MSIIVTVLLLGINAAPIVGTLLFSGVVLAGIGATVLGYFAALGGALKGASRLHKPGSFLRIPLPVGTTGSEQVRCLDVRFAAGAQRNGARA